MKFPAWKKEESPTSTNDEPLTNEEPTSTKTEFPEINTDTKETITEQPTQVNYKIAVEQKASKLEDVRNYIVRTITKSGYPLVIRSEQNMVIQEEIKNEIVLLLEENERLTKEALRSNKQITDDDEYMQRTANFYYFQGNMDKSIERYEQVLKRNPSKMTALNNKGVLLDYMGKHDEAIEYFNRALSHVPENVHVLSNKGIALYKNGRYEEALV